MEVLAHICFSGIEAYLFNRKERRKEYEVALQRAEMKMVRWMCSVKLYDRISSKGLRERPGLDDIISVLQQNRQ